MNGAELITQERQRQIDVEGWTAKHDSGNINGELAMAAACYAFDTASLPTITAKEIVYNNWPWSLEWWKPTPDNHVRQLTKAGALIAAEIDRLQREMEGVRK